MFFFSFFLPLTDRSFLLVSACLFQTELSGMLQWVAGAQRAAAGIDRARAADRSRPTRVHARASR